MALWHDNAGDGQRHFLPDLKRAKSTSSSNRSGSLVCSEFSYEGMTEFKIDKYTHKHLRDERLAGSDCFVEQVLKGEESAYSRMIAWIDEAEYRTLHVEHIDRKS